MALSINKYEYLNEDTIDDELLCSICTQPLQSPVSLACQHIFCEYCIETWIKTNASCPICRLQFVTKHTLTTMTNVDRRNQLDSLLVRCLQCNKSGIKRIDFAKHLRRCSKSRLTFLSNLFHSRWRPNKRSRRSEHDHQVTSHQARLVPLTETFHTNHVQQDVHLQNNEQQFSDLRSRIFEETTFSRSNILQLHEQVRRNRELAATREPKANAIYYICIALFIIWFLRSFGEAILIFALRLGLVIFLLFFVWLCVKAKRRN